MSNLIFSLPTNENLYNDNKLDMLKTYGSSAAITDFGILTSGFVSSVFHVNDERSLENRCGDYWFIIDNDNRRTTDGDGLIYNYYDNGKRGAIRPIISYSNIKDNCKNKTIIKENILQVEYGEYPQQVATHSLQVTLEDLYKTENLNKTNKTYTINNGKNDEELLKTINIDEYEYNEKKYIRIIPNLYFMYKYDGILLSNGKTYTDKKPVWVEVTPIKWLIDEKQDIAISEKILFAGTQFHKDKNYEGSFENSDIKKFLDFYFSKDIIPSKTKEKFNIILKPETRNPKVIEASIEYKPGMNITIKLPEEIINNIEQINIESLEDSNKQFTYIKKR